ncbi:MAG: hypothetical protein QNJ41_23545 [Xenococcaceae cyanobacterium MO_188.B32]|nr:hypothetical protein [Xenococcaceae cyanobacterium MO_188.B32]
MVQEPRRDEPLYSCIVPVESVTGNQEEELTAFATSASSAYRQAELMLADNYGCNIDQIKKLMELARIEYLSPWCLRG